MEDKRSAGMIHRVVLDCGQMGGSEGRRLIVGWSWSSERIPEWSPDGASVVAAPDHVQKVETQVISLL
jgi:hypothetical protein